VIHVQAQPEPESFDAQIRVPGKKALDAGKHPLPDYWRRCLPDLRDAYDEICAYSCFRIPEVVGSKSVEHFAAKSQAPELAYEWSNYRLVCSLMNSCKREFEDVLDPFEVGDDWFELEFLFLQVRPAAHLPDDIREAVQSTIDRLKLSEAECCRERAYWYECWRNGDVSDMHVKRSAPFIFREAVRQDLVPRIPG